MGFSVIHQYSCSTCHRFARSRSPNKSSDVVATKLGPYRGTLTADAEHRFNAVYATGRVLESGCNAHGRRKFRDAEETQPCSPSKAARSSGRCAGKKKRRKKLGLVGDALREHRQQFVRPIANDFERWLDMVQPALLPSEPLMTAVRYYKNHRNALFRFIDDPDLPIDNSATEREFQNVAKLRLNMLFAGSTEGAHRACVLLGTVGTCRAVGVPVRAYLARAFERLRHASRRLRARTRRDDAAAFKNATA